MSRHASICVAVSAAVIIGLAGCGKGTQQAASQASRPAPPATAPADDARTGSGRETPACPCANCLTNCGGDGPNGTGIYTAEGGKAAIGDAQLMITHFNNTGTSVTFDGIYRNPHSGIWQPLAHPGHVDRADYRSVGRAVLAVSEASTVPTWRLLDTVHPSAPILVSGPDLAELELHISFEFPIVVTMAATRSYVLAFQPAPPAPPGPGPTNARRAAIAFRMRWRLPNIAAASAIDYCSDAGSNPDPIVFQQGIAVDPFTGAVTRPPGAVTMSCRLGAPAVVYSWGYEYQGDYPATYYFDAAIHMKRASYCADARHYTVTGTMIQIDDDAVIHQTPNMALLEAEWTPHGASCIHRDANGKPDHLRYPKLDFQGICYGKQVPACASVGPGAPPPPSPYLADAPDQVLP
jgi:hypothetical protein